MEMGINVSRGTALAFDAGEKRMSGIIISSRKEGMDAVVIVECAEMIPNNVPLTVPGSDCGGCGLSNPEKRGECWWTILRMRFACVDDGTIGK